MPETYLTLKWPDGSVSEEYSPSSIIRSFFTPGETLDIATFLTRARLAMSQASARVQQVHGFPCARARATLASLEAKSGIFLNTPDAGVTILDLQT
ncbi:MAG: MSMEG_0570 family nitrogen starvation response protein [Acidocella sp.]|nr:MSMEG_0570 family nitrogen starvation response protein [Acidocella sp.]